MLPTAEVRAGLAAAVAAYSMWGLLPVYFHAVSFAKPWEILALRVLWSVPVGAALLLATGSLAPTLAALRAPGVARALMLSATFIGVNWGAYIWAVSQHRVLEASLAYFVAPLVNVAVGVIALKERITPAQLAALVLAACGVIVQGWALGAPPWLGLLMCATWCAYAFVRKQTPVPATGGFLVEAVALAPLALIGVGVLAQSPQGLASDDSWARGALMALAGVVTALPLVLFGFGARRLQLSTLGALQFLAPSLQFICGALYGEPVTALRLWSFALIWTGLLAYTVDGFARERRRGALPT